MTVRDPCDRPNTRLSWAGYHSNSHNAAPGRRGFRSAASSAPVPARRQFGGPSGSRAYPPLPRPPPAPPPCPNSPLPTPPAPQRPPREAAPSARRAAPLGRAAPPARRPSAPPRPHSTQPDDRRWRRRDTSPGSLRVASPQAGRHRPGISRSRGKGGVSLSGAPPGPRMVRGSRCGGPPRVTPGVAASGRDGPRQGWRPSGPGAARGAPPRGFIGPR